MDTLDQWEKETEEIESDWTLEQDREIQECRERILALINLVRKKDEFLNHIIDDSYENQKQCKCDRLANEALDLTKELK